MESVYRGAGVAIVTPMKEDGSINYDVYEQLIEEQIAGGTDAIVVAGTTGEASTLSHEEQVELIKFTCDKVNQRVPVIAGTSSNCTDTAVYLAVEAQRCGADAVLVASPYYNKATQNGLKEHFKKIADAVAVPIILYNIPGRTGVNIEPETIAYLVENVDNIVGVKEASGNMEKITKLFVLIKEKNIKCDVYSGNDDQIVPIMSLGGAGVISVLSNVAPKQTHDICMAMFDNDHKSAAQKQLEAVRLINALFCEVNPIPVKAALNILGKNVGIPRLPLTDMEVDNKKILKDAMKDYGLL